MKNVQIIDGADNCSYSIFQMTDEEFSRVFPEPGQDIEFIEDFLERDRHEAEGLDLSPVWSRPVAKADVRGIHGTLFYELLWKKKYYPTKRDDEIINYYLVD